MLRRFGLFSILFILGVACCKQADSRDHSAESRPVETAEATAYTEWNDRALLLAGMPVSARYAARPEVAALLARPGYTAHKQKMDGFWKSVEAKRLSAIIPWREKHLRDRIHAKTALYPLSGGDFLNLNLMFPHAERYIMIAMEKPGDMPDPTAMDEAHLRNGLASVQQMLGNIAQTGYFFSRLMNMYMNPESYGFYGTMPTVSVFLVRLGHSIQNIERACITEEGQLEVYADRAKGFCRVQGYRVRFRDGKSGVARELVYLSARIDNNLFSAATPEGKFFRTIQNPSVMLKAAVYLLHSPNYRGAADYILETADVVLQDDSGLPFRYYEPARWDVELYGSFVAPPRMTGIEYYPQPDLVKAFKEKALELPFDFGYGQVEPTNKSGIILAFKRK